MFGNAVSDANHAEVTRGHHEEGFKNGWRDESEDGHGVARCANEDNAQATTAKILLKAKALIHGDHGVILRLCGIEQGPVVEVRPPAAMNGLNAMPGKKRTEGPRQVAVEKDPHAAARPPG